VSPASTAMTDPVMPLLSGPANHTKVRAIFLWVKYAF
jgi:hypothetical protein